MIEMIVRWTNRKKESVFKLQTDRWSVARHKMEKLIFDGYNVESVTLTDSEHIITEMCWTYSSEDGWHVEEYSVVSDEWQKTLNALFHDEVKV